MQSTPLLLCKSSRAELLWASHAVAEAVAESIEFIGEKSSRRVAPYRAIYKIRAIEAGGAPRLKRIVPVNDWPTSDGGALKRACEARGIGLCS